MDETWLYNFTPESKRLSSESTAHGEATPNYADATHGVIIIDCVEKGKLSTGTTK